jgi:hypothetical protein
VRVCVVQVAEVVCEWASVCLVVAEVAVVCEWASVCCGGGRGGGVV